MKATTSSVSVGDVSGTDDIGELFAIVRNSNGTYTIRPAVSGNDRALGVNNPDAGGAAVTSRTCVSSDCYQWWQFNQIGSQFTTSVNNYYDHAFHVRYSDLGSYQAGIQQVNSFAATLFSSKYNIGITNNTPTLITSTADACKTKQGKSINTVTIDERCPGGVGHTPECTSWDQSYIDFIRNPSYTGGANKISILWTGNMLYDPDSGECVNRSYSWYDNGITLQEISWSGNHYDNVTSTLIHEMSHQFGAPDHYHEWLEDGSCRGGDLCIECHPSTGRPALCLMGGGGIPDIKTHNIDEIWCDGCQEDIRNWLYAQY